MTPWAPVPLALNDDPRVRLRTPVEQLTLVRLYLIARGADIVPMPPLRAGEAAHAVWRRLWGAETADAVGQLVEAGLVLVEPAGLRLALATGARSGAPRAMAAHDLGERADASVEVTPETIAARTRKLRHVFTHRAGELVDVDPGLSWEAWLATDHGRETYARRVLGHNKTARPRNASGTFRGRSDGTTGTPQERHGNGHRNAPPVLSETSGIEEKEREKRERNATGTERGTERNGTPQERSDGTLLAALQSAAAGRATLTGALAIEQEFGHLLERHRLTADEIERAAKAFEDPSAWWPRGKNPAPKHVTLNDLAGFRGDSGFEWRAVSALVAHVRASKRTAPKPSPLPAAPARGPVVTAEETRRLLEASRGARRDSSPPIAAAAPGGTP